MKTSATGEHLHSPLGQVKGVEEAAIYGGCEVGCGEEEEEELRDQVTDRVKNIISKCMTM